MKILEVKEKLKWCSLKQPLFYNSKYGLRFEIGTPDISTFTDEYFENAMYRISSLYEDIFLQESNLYVIIESYRSKDEYDKINWKLPKNIRDCFLTSKLDICNETYLSEDDECIMIHSYIKTRVQDFNYMELLKGITGKEIGRIPSIDETIYISNDSLDIVFLYYDDRGADIVSKDITLLESIYNHRNDWILDYDRKKITEMMEKFFNTI
jgi:hypothetical protein